MRLPATEPSLGLNHRIAAGLPAIRFSTFSMRVRIPGVTLGALEEVKRLPVHRRLCPPVINQL